VSAENNPEKETHADGDADRRKGPGGGVFASGFDHVGEAVPDLIQVGGSFFLRVSGQIRQLSPGFADVNGSRAAEIRRGVGSGLSQIVDIPARSWKRFFVLHRETISRHDVNMQLIPQDPV
jgi:hypothetical protein